MTVLFIQPDLTEEDISAVTAALRARQLGGNGQISHQVEAQLRALTGARHALLTTSCSHALELALMSLRIGPGDEVILPSFAFVTAASAVVRQGARPVFAEIEESTFNIDPNDVARRITNRTRAIIPVHYAGHGCRMSELTILARQHNLWIVEDAAQGIGATYNGQPLGTIGHIGCYSFHHTKNIVAGEGGAFLTNSDELAWRAEIIREKGTNRSAFLRGEVDKYTWVEIGSSYVPSDLLAALLGSQLKRLEQITSRRVAIWERYFHGLAELEERGLVVRPILDSLARHNGHIFALRVAPARRDYFIAELNERGVAATFHFVPLHSSPFGQQALGYRAGDFPITERVAASLVRLPLHTGVTPEQVDYVLEIIKRVLTQ
jgi:dTDP-4-amino-4,6-dideoxygalactose transaminase